MRPWGATGIRSIAETVVLEEISFAYTKNISSVCTEMASSVYAEEISSVYTEEIASVYAEEISSVYTEEISSVFLTGSSFPVFVPAVLFRFFFSGSRTF